MKKIRFFAFLTIAIINGHILLAQCWENSNTITTDWRNYPGAGGNNLSQNNWNWTNDYPNFASAYITSNKDVITQKIVPVPISSPFYSPQVSTGQNINLEHFQSKPFEQKDFWPEDGWELLVKNFGECPNPPDCYASTAVDNPFFALYNRVTGQVRAFMLIVKSPTDKKMNGAMIEMNFSASGAKRALFSHAQPIGKAIDNFDNTLYQRSPNRYVNEENFWIYADFIMSYDPCTCFNPTLDSRLVFRYSLLYDSQITLKGVGVIDEKIIQKTDGGVVATSGGYSGLFGMDIDPATAIKQGMKAFKTWEGYEKEANKFIDAQNAVYHEKLEEEFVENAPVLPFILNGSLITSADQLRKLDKGTKALLGLSEDIPGTLLLEGLASSLPYVGTAIAVIDMFVSGGTKKQETKAARAPMSFEIKQDFQGTIKSENPVGDRFFHTPGSKITAPNWLPIYNNTLGVFNLLKEPKMEHVVYQPLYYNGGPVPSDASGSIPKLRQYKTKENLKFVLNPSSNLEILAIDAAYVIEYDNRFKNAYDMAPGVMMSNWFLELGAPDLSLNIEERLNQSGLELEYISKDYPSTGVLRVRTPYVPISCFNQQSFILLHRSFSSDPLPNYSPMVFIKFYIKMRRKDVMGAEDVTMVTTHRINDLVGNSTVVSMDPDPNFQMGRTMTNLTSWFAWPSHFSNGMPTFPNPGFLPVDLELANKNITSDVTAKRNIIIGLNNTYSPGVVIRAGKNITFKQGSNVNVNNVSFVIEDVSIGAKCSSGVLGSKATNSDISSVCTSSSYLGKVNGGGGFKIGEVLGEDLEEENGRNVDPYNTQLLKVKPNPLFEEGVVTFSVPQKQSIEISIIDFYGNTVYEIVKAMTLDKGIYELPFSTTTLAPGMYILKFSSGGYVKNEKIMVVK